MSLRDLKARDARRDRLATLVLVCLAAIALAALITAGPSDTSIAGWGS